MSPDRVNLLNIGLMILSCAAAFVLPFELFLFSYAVLGPLHYLTQISWLHSRGYFTEGARDFWLLGGLCALLLLVKYVPSDLDRPGWATAIVVLAFAGAFATTLVHGTRARAIVLVVGAVAAFSVRTLDAAQIVFTTFVPTIIHVYVFTAAFILYGALRSRSTTGLASLGVFVVCTASIFATMPSDRSAAPGAYVRSTYGLFADLNAELASWLGLPALDALEDVYASPAGITIMRFIAFAYTYHYLNWFSKTSIIQWHRIPRSWTFANVVLWLCAVMLYAWDYEAGLLVLFSLSWLHVILELPLDHRTFVGIGRELRTLAPRGRAPVPG